MPTSSLPLRASGLAFLLGVLAAPALAQRLAAEDRESAVVRISELLQEHYVFEDVAEACADRLYERLEDGAYDPRRTAESFATALTRDLQDVSHDRHLTVRVGKAPPPEERLGGHEPEIRPEELQEMARANYGFRRVEILDHNVGYLDLRGFLPAKYASETAAAAMKFLSHADAIVIDLRENGGGEPSMEAFLASYFFAGRTQLNSLYSRAQDVTVESWTLDEIDGTRMPETPLFVLTSSQTFSCAEAFTYDLQAVHRATVIGERTGGGAHAGDTMSVGDDLVIFLPCLRAIHPATGTNWEGTGIQPDIAVPASEALDRACAEALQAIQKRAG